MASTPSNNRLKLTPSNSPFLQRPFRSPIRPRASPSDLRLSLTRVIGTTCFSPTSFDVVESCFAYVAGGAVVVVHVQEAGYSQRFYRARPTAIPLFAVSPVPYAPQTPNSTPKANDSRNRVAAASPREALYSPSDWSDPHISKTWTSRERIKAATCLALSRDARYLAVGETGYAPRVLIFGLHDSSSDAPVVSISEHTFGVRAVAWSPDTRYLASLGAANDGFLYVWKIDPRTGAAKLFQQNRCTSFIRGMVWMGSSLITLGVRHIKVWRVEEGPGSSPARPKDPFDSPFPQTQPQKALPGRNILLGSLLDSTFTCAAAVSDSKAIICSESGDVCLLDDTEKAMRLVKVLEIGFIINCISLRERAVHIGGRQGEVAVLSLDKILDQCPDPVISISHSLDGLLAMGFLTEGLVTIDTKRSIDIWGAGHTATGSSGDTARITIPGHGDPVIGIQRLRDTGSPESSFFTWSSSGRVSTWTLDGRMKSSFRIPLGQIDSAHEPDRANQLLIVRATRNANYFVAGDKLGVLRAIDPATEECVMEIKAHSSDCQDLAVYEDGGKVLLASCGRDRTVQLFCRLGDGDFEHFQTLEFAARVVKVLILSGEKIISCSLDRTLQVHDLVSKEGEPGAMAAIPSKVLSLRASPSSMAVAPDGRFLYVSLLDRSVCQYDLDTGRLSNSFKCLDEAGIESVILDCLTCGRCDVQESSLLLGVSNTDKSVRLYHMPSGTFIDREWGHTESINGVALIDEDDGGRKVVSAGSDGTIMVWSLDVREAVAGSASREPSPEKGSFPPSIRPPLRRVLSKAELAEFQKPSPPHASGRRSPPRSLLRRSSRHNLSSLSVARTPTSMSQTSPSGITAAGTPSRRPSFVGSPSGSPPESPKGRRRINRRPSLPVLNGSLSSASSMARKKTSTSNLRASYGFGSLSMATEQTSRQLRTYRKKLSSAEPIGHDVLAELDAELRLTAAALGERAIRTRSSREARGKDKTVSETVLSGLLDQYSERIMSMLNERLGLKLDDDTKEEEKGGERPGTAGGDSNSSAGTLSADGSSTA